MASQIIEGRWKGASIFRTHDGQILVDGIVVTHMVRGYEVVAEGRKVGSGLGGAAAGALLLGPIGLAGGILAARKKRTSVVTWDTGEQSMAEVSVVLLHKDFVAAAFRNHAST